MLIASSFVVEEFTVSRSDRNKVLVRLGDRIYGIPWRQADEIAADLRRRTPSEVPDGPNLEMVLMSIVKDRIHLIPQKLCAKLWPALLTKARECEEQEQAERIAYDNAILFRAGVPIGLSDDPKIRDETAKLAAWDSDLRRYMPGGIKSKVMCGTPVIVVHPPKEKVS